MATDNQISLMAPLRRPVSLLVMPEVVQHEDKITLTFPNLEAVEFQGDEDRLTLVREDIHRAWFAAIQKFRASLDCLEHADPVRSYPWLRNKKKQ